jgi:YjbE family integral membrane protein
MELLGDPAFWGRVLRIVGIDILLAGDNALVIALAVRTLDRKQQMWGRVWGTAGAVVLRLVFITFVTMLLGISLLHFAGGALLVWIAIKLLLQEGEEHGSARPGTTLWQAVWIIIVADVGMSVDNVLAVAGAAGGDLKLVAFGIALSIPLVVWGSGLLSSLMSRHQWIIWLGGGILGEVAGHMMIHDPVVNAWLGDTSRVLEYPVRIGLFAGLTLLGWWRARSARARAEAGLSHGRG